MTRADVVNSMLFCKPYPTAATNKYFEALGFSIKKCTKYKPAEFSYLG